MTPLVNLRPLDLDSFCALAVMLALDPGHLGSCG